MAANRIEREADGVSGHLSHSEMRTLTDLCTAVEKVGMRRFGIVVATVKMDLGLAPLRETEREADIFESRREPTATAQRRGFRWQ
jgi:hypothetical protein